MGIIFKKGGLLTTVQDEGRIGFQQFGVSPAGPMDEMAFKVANILVGNAQNEAALEISFMGPVIEFTTASHIAITGGDLKPALNGTEVEMYQTLKAEAGDVLSFRGMSGNGCRGYIAFRAKQIGRASCRERVYVLV